MNENNLPTLQAPTSNTDTGNKMVFQPIIESEDRSQIGDAMFKHYMDEAPLVYTNRVQLGEIFKGTVFILKCSIRSNLYQQELYDGVFQCVDGNGVRFTGNFWGMDYKFESHQAPAYIEGLKYNVDSGKVIYKLTKISQSKIDVPKSAFLKQIPSFNTQKAIFQTNIAKITNASMAQIRESALGRNLENDFANEPLANTYGVELGCKFQAFNAMVETCESQMKLSEGVDSDLLYLGCLLKLWQPTIYIMNKDDAFELTDKTYFYAEDIIHNSTLEPILKIKLLSILRGNEDNLESIIVNNAHKTVRNIYRAKDKLLNTINGIQLGIMD